MRILIIKTSSFGDIIHTFPALSDAMRLVPAVEFDWIVEQQYADFVLLHPAVERAIVVDCKKWLKPNSWHTRKKDTYWQQAKDALNNTYDMIIDAQGLMRVAWLLWFTKNTIIGYDWHSVREPLASLWYDKKIAVPKNWHAVERSRQLVAAALGYQRQLGDYQARKQACEYHLARNQPVRTNGVKKVLFAHGSRWNTKLWSLKNWQALAQLCTDYGCEVYVPYGNASEYTRAQAIVATNPTNIKLLTARSTTSLVSAMHTMDAVVSVDSALAHMAAALAVPSVCVFGATNPARTRPYGKQQEVIASTRQCVPCLSRTCRIQPNFSQAPPCMEDIKPTRIFTQLQTHLSASFAH